MELANKLYFPNDFLPTTQENIKEALSLYELASEKGNCEAKYQLGVIFFFSMSDKTNSL